MRDKVNHLTDTQKTLAKKTKQLEKHYTKLTPDELKPLYSTFCVEARDIEEDLKEANRRKPKKAKVATPSKAGDGVTSV